jgi:hypothetical protein
METPKRPEMDLGGIGWIGMNRIGLPQDRDHWRILVNAVMKLQGP